MNNYYFLLFLGKTVLDTNPHVLTLGDLPNFTALAGESNLLIVLPVVRVKIYLNFPISSPPFIFLFYVKYLM